MSTLSYTRFLSRKWRTAPKRSTFYIGWLVQPWNLLDRVGWVIHSTHWQMKLMIIHMVDLWRDSCMFWCLINNFLSLFSFFLWRPLAGGPIGFFANQFAFRLAARFNFPRLKRMIINLIPSKRVQDLKEVVDIMSQTSIEIIKSKKEAMRSTDPRIAAEIQNKKDIISILSAY